VPTAANGCPAPGQFEEILSYDKVGQVTTQGVAVNRHGALNYGHVQATYEYDIERKPAKAVYPLYPNSGEYRFGYDTMSRLNSISKWQSSQLLPVISQIQYGVAEQVHVDFLRGDLCGVQRGDGNADAELQ
jgi:hypothetical protein